MKKLVVCLLLLLGFAGCQPQTTTSSDGQMSSVGNSVKVTKTVGEKENFFFIQKINKDSVEGLADGGRSDPVGTFPPKEGDPQTLYIGDDIGRACEGISDTLTHIDFEGQKITFTVIQNPPPMGGCPICLSHNVNIATPNGEIPVFDLTTGSIVWSLDDNGNRIAVPILKTTKIAVPADHKVIQLRLADGRNVDASLPHPTFDGRTMAELKVGETFDGSIITSAKISPYDGTYTYDLLPTSTTATYWANGILLQSTLKP